MLGVLLLTAGLGTRMRRLSRSRPKSLMPVLGIPTLEWILAMMKGLDFKVTTANVHNLRDAMMEGIWEWNRKSPAHLLQAVEEEVLLGSGGGLVHVARRFPEIKEWLVLNGDSFLDETLVDFLSIARQQAVELETNCVLLSHKGSSADYTSLRVEGSRLTGFSPGQKDALFFTGVSWWKASWLHQFRAGSRYDLVQDLLEPLIKKKEVGINVRESQWFDIGTPQAYYETHLALILKWQKGGIPAHWAGLVQASFIEEGVLATKNGSLRPECKVQGLNFLDTRYQGSSLGPGAVIYFDPPKGLDEALKGIWVEEGVWCV